MPLTRNGALNGQRSRVRCVRLAPRWAALPLVGYLLQRFHLLDDVLNGFQSFSGPISTT